MAFWLSNLALVLKNAGLSVVEIDGWKTRTFATWTPPGYVVKPTHVMVHHTASKTAVENDINYILHGPVSPICNIFLARDGVCHVIAAGRVATNGKGSSISWNGQVPDNMMNHYAISIEAANNGIGEPWPEVQTKAYVTLCAALCSAYQIPIKNVRGHFEWAPTRKIDPAGPSPWSPDKSSWDMDKFRQDVFSATKPSTSILLEDNMEILNPPVRILDTRSNNSKLEAGTTRIVALGPNSNISAAMINITAVGAAGPGYMTAWAPGSVRPTTSALNYQNSNAVCNAVIVPVVNGTINVFSSQASHLVVDLYATWA